MYGDWYFLTVTCDMLGDYSYFIRANDIFHNANVTSLFQFSVIHPQEPPEITDIVAFPNPQEFPQPIQISSVIVDNVAVGEATVIVKKDEGVIGNYTLQGINTDEYG